MLMFGAGIMLAIAPFSSVRVHGWVHLCLTGQVLMRGDTIQECDCLRVGPVGGVSGRFRGANAVPSPSSDDARRERGGRDSDRQTDRQRLIKMEETRDIDGAGN